MAWGAVLTGRGDGFKGAQHTILRVVAEGHAGSGLGAYVWVCACGSTGFWCGFCRSMPISMSLCLRCLQSFEQPGFGAAQPSEQVEANIKKRTTG